MTRTQEGNVFQAIIFAMVTMIAKMVQMNNLTYVVSVKTLGISTFLHYCDAASGSGIGSSVNPIATRGKIMPTTLLLAHPDLKTQLHL